MAFGGSDFLKDFQELMFVSKQEGSITSYGGWKRGLLVEDIVTATEQKLLLCTLCRGMMRDACVVTLDGKKQAHCESCLPTGFRLYARHKADFIRSFVDERMVHCPFIKEGCKWTVSTIDLQFHLKECLHVSIPCPLGCFEPNNMASIGSGFTIQKIQRQQLPDHLSNVCPMRKIPCEYCEKGITASFINSHLTTCEEYPIECENKCSHGKGDGIVFMTGRKSMSDHLKNHCPLEEISCPYSEHGCVVKFVRKELMFHKAAFVHEHLSLVEDILNTTKTKLENSISSKPISVSGGVEWSVRSFQSRMNRKKDFHSPPLYSCGYKFCFSVQFDSSEHMGLYFGLLKGEDDDQLKWPCQCKFKVVIVNQLSHLNMTKTVSSDEFPVGVDWFDKPKSCDEPIYFGFNDLVTYDYLLTHNFLSDDALLLRILLSSV